LAIRLEDEPVDDQKPFAGHMRARMGSREGNGFEKPAVAVKSQFLYTSN
jgi:hypothetical protein